MQQARLFPVLAASFAFHATGTYMSKMVRSGNIGSLHVASSGLKALCSKITCDNIESCRKACGGHGYLLSSGLPDLLGTYKQNATVEGENFMIAQQTTRQLLKMMNAGIENVEVTKDIEYIFQCEEIAKRKASMVVNSVEDFFNPTIQTEAYKQRAAYTLLYLQKKIKRC